MNFPEKNKVKTGASSYTIFISKCPKTPKNAVILRRKIRIIVFYGEQKFCSSLGLLPQRSMKICAQVNFQA